MLKTHLTEKETPMKTLAAALMLCSSALLASTAVAQNLNVRGEITAVSGNTISVKTRDARVVQVDVPDNTPVSTTATVQFADFKPGQVLAVTTIKRADGATVAIDVRPISATANQGLSPYDLQPESTMTNAALEAVVQSTSGGEMTLNYKTGTVKVLVPAGTPMSRAVPGQRSDLKPGESVFIVAKPAADGKLSAVRVQVSKDGVKPTQ